VGWLRFELAFWSIVLAAGVGAVFVVSVAEGAWIIAAFSGISGLVTIRSLLRTSKVAADASKALVELENLPDSPPMSGEQSEALAAIDEFDESIFKAYGIPFTDQVRLDRRKFHRLLDRLRGALDHGPFEVAAMLDQLDELAQRAKPIPLTDQIRINREEIYDVLDRMRASIGEGS